MADASWLKRTSTRSGCARASGSPAGGWTADARPSTTSCYLLGWLLLYRPLRTKLGLRRVRWPSAAPHPSRPGARVLLGARRPGAGGLRPDREHGPGHLTPSDKVKIGKVGRRAGGGAPHRRRRRDPHPRARRATSSATSRTPRPRAETVDRGLAAHRRRRRARRGRVPPDHRPQEGPHHHRGRQEHQPVGDREQAEGVAVRARGRRDRRPAQVPDRPHRDRARHRGRLGHPAASPTPPTRTCRPSRRCASWSPSGWSTSTTSSPRSSRSRTSGCSPTLLDHENGQLTATRR
jgi:hypothetical protein